MKDLQQQINAIYDQQRYDLDIGIYKCLNGQKNHQRAPSIKALHHIISKPILNQENEFKGESAECASVHKHRRDPQDSFTSFKMGNGINGPTLYGNQTDGIPILLIPSHINRGYIMDLMPEYSFVKKLESCGMSPYLLEWNDPSDEILQYSEAEYIESILMPIINYISAQHNGKILILGHCLGGVMALAATQLLQEKISGLITVATPWDFHHSSFIYKANHDVYNFILKKANGAYIPKELIHMMMNWPHINTSINKLISISNLEKINDLFFAVENWLDDNVNMTIPLLETCIVKYSIQNQTYKSEWSVLGNIIHPKNISIPMLNVIPMKDKVVPQGSSAPLSISSKNNQTLNLDTGHIGMLISRNDNFALEISDWAKKHTIKKRPSLSNN